MKTIILYGTDYCHLCEQAAALLGELPEELYCVEKFDISENDELMDRYSLRIPVVHLQGKNDDLGWPFDHLSLTEYLNANCENASD